MTDPNDKKPEEGPVTGRQTIREVMEAVRVAQQEEAREELLTERKRRREAKEKRIRERRERQVKRATETKRRRQGALNEANGKVANHLAVASRELRAALRDATSVPLPRHSQEGREQLRVRRSIEGALSALRQVGRGTFHVPDVDLDFDDVGT
jgi:hypothetical protein